MRTKIYLETVGQGLPMVLLHGWGFNSKIFHSFVKRASNHFKCILIDLPGFGQSRFYKGSDNIENIAETLIALKKIPKNAIWLGWSLGGLIALWIALYFPERISQLVTIATSPRLTSKDTWPGVHPRQIKRFERINRQSINNPKDCEILQSFVSLNIFPETGSLIKQKISNMIDFNNLPALQGGLSILRELDLRDNIANVKQPWLQIYGGQDTIVPVAVSEKLQTLTPMASIQVLIHAGHMPFVSHEVESINLINAFLDRSFLTKNVTLCPKQTLTKSIRV